MRNNFGFKNVTLENNLPKISIKSSDFLYENIRHDAKLLMNFKDECST